MATFFELEHKLLNEHGKEYNAFTRLLLTISVACITLLASTNTVNGSWLYASSFICLFLSILFGVLVQHRIMMNPIYHLEDAREKIIEAENNGRTEDIELRRKPSGIEQVFYRLQGIAFVLAFLFIAVFFIEKAI